MHFLQQQRSVREKGWVTDLHQYNVKVHDYRLTSQRLFQAGLRRELHQQHAFSGRARKKTGYLKTESAVYVAGGCGGECSHKTRGLGSRYTGSGGSNNLVGIPTPVTWPGIPGAGRQLFTLQTVFIVT